jgi:hypothetical protein
LVATLLQAKRHENKQAAEQYRRYLEEMMVKDKEDTAVVDEVRRREEEKVWKAREDALQAREDARTYLMKMVDEGRQQQIQERREQSRREEEEGKVFADRFLLEARAGVEQERAEAMQRRGVAVDNNQRLKEQMALKQHRLELEQQEQYLADKKMKYIERQHQQRLADQGGLVRTNFPMQQGKWYT